MNETADAKCRRQVDRVDTELRAYSSLRTTFRNFATADFAAWVAAGS